MTLSIVIVSFNAREDLERCLASLHAAPPKAPHDITVVDNGSTDSGLELLKARWPSLQVIALEKNCGFAAGNNVGIRASRGELILLLNSDTVVAPGAVDALVERLLAHTEAAAAGPRLVDGEGRIEMSFGRMISPLGELRQKVIGVAYETGVAPVRSWVARTFNREQFVDWVSGACLLVRRPDAEAVGLLDERFFLYTEDVDFCAALRARGRKILFTPQAQIVHLRGRSRATAPGAMEVAYRRSQIAFYEKHHPGWAPLLRLYLKVKGVKA